MQIEAKDIEGLVPEKRPTHWVDSFSEITIGFNEALDLISQKKLEVVISRQILNQLIRDTVRTCGWLPEVLADQIITSAKEKGFVKIVCVNERNKNE